MLMTRGSFNDIYGQTLLPFLRALTFNQYRRRQAAWRKLYRTETSTREFEQFSQIVGLTTFQQIGEGEGLKFDALQQGFRATMTHKKWVLGIKITRETVDDGRWNLVVQGTKELAASCVETQDLLAAQPWNSAFDPAAVLPDQKPLCAVDHPLIRYGAQSNTLSVPADLAHDSLERAMVDWSLLRDHTGKFIHAPLKNLVVHPSNYPNAITITRTTQRSGTANNDINALRQLEDGVPDVMSYRYLTNPKAWFLTTDPNNTAMRWFWRDKPERKSYHDTQNEIAIYWMRMRLSFAPTDFYGIWGCPGS